LVEQRLLEKLREDVESLWKLLPADVKIEVSILVPGGSIGVTSVFFDKLLVILLIRVFLRSKEEHMLTEMSHTSKLLALHIGIIWIIETSNSDVETRSTFVSIWVVYEDGL